MVEFVGLDDCWKVEACISTGVARYEYRFKFFV